MYGWKMLEMWFWEYCPVWHSFHNEVKFGHLVQVHNMISRFCCTQGLHYIGNRNIKADFLYKEVLHLLDKGKIVLANNFIINLNENVLTTHIHHPTDAFWIRNVFQSLLTILWKKTYKYYKMTGSNFKAINI